MEAQQFEVRVRLFGLGVTSSTCEARLGIVGNYIWDKPHLPSHHAWGLSVHSRTVHLSEVVESVLSQVYAVRQQWNALLDEHPEWTAGMACTVTMETREPRHGDYPCLILEADQVRRMADLRLEFDLGFR